MLQAWRMAECSCRRVDTRFAAMLLWRAGYARGSDDEEEYRDPARDAMFLEARLVLCRWVLT